MRLDVSLILLLLAVGVVAGCDNYDPPKKSITLQTPTGEAFLNYRIVVIESCEYILVDGSREQSITHKGNCKNPAHYKLEQ
jgi:hypothetical protein